ncbi:MAG: methyl-accepting chemotaxis protein, partial [Candidatus Electrothrix sp. AR4]|nr:methyl-accepting chemotaxis protein [Candidatus Electrothrix sp. AR4]
MRQKGVGKFQKGTGLTTKLVGLLLLVGLIPFAINAVASYFQASSALEQAANNQLEGIRELKKGQIVGYLEEREGDMEVLANLVQSLRREGISKLKAIETTKKVNLEGYLQDRLADISIVASNLTTVRAVQEFGEAFSEEGGRVSGSLWNGYKEQYGGWFSEFRDVHGYYDVFLLSSAGDVLYTAAEESDLGQSVTRGSLQNSGLGRVFAKAVKKSGAVFEDYAPYAPSNNQYSGFVAAPILQNGRLIGVVAMQLSTTEINEVVQQREGLTSSFESYMVGNADEPTLHSDRVVKEGRIGDPKSGPDTDAVLAGKEGVLHKMGSTGMFELSSYVPIKAPGLNWGLITNGTLSEVVVPKGEGDAEDLLQRYQKAYGYFDIFLVDPSGYVFYSVEQEADYHTNMISGKYSDSNLGRLIQKVASTKKPAMADYEPYAPSNMAPASFFAAPVIDKGELVMVIAVQISDTDIQGIMGEATGLGKTGETYLVGDDKLLRSDSRLVSDAKLLKTEVQTDATVASLGERKTGVEQIKDYRGADVLSAYAPLGLKEALGTDFEWAIVAEIDTDEALAASNRMFWFAIVGALVIGLIVFGVALFVGGLFARPIVAIAEIVRQVAADRDLTLNVPVTSKDEVGEMANEFNTMLVELNTAFTEVQTVSQAVASNAEDVAGRASANRDRAEVEAKQSEKTQELLETMGETAGKVATGAKAQQDSAQ